MCWGVGGSYFQDLSVTKSDSRKRGVTKRCLRRCCTYAFANHEAIEVVELADQRSLQGKQGVHKICRGECVLPIESVGCTTQISLIQYVLLTFCQPCFSLYYEIKC